MLGNYTDLKREENAGKLHGPKKRGECWEITKFKVTNIHLTSAYSSSVTCFDSEIILNVYKSFDLRGLAD